MLVVGGPVSNVLTLAACFIMAVLMSACTTTAEKPAPPRAASSAATEVAAPSPPALSEEAAALAVRIFGSRVDRTAVRLIGDRFGGIVGLTGERIETRDVLRFVSEISRTAPSGEASVTIKFVGIRDDGTAAAHYYEWDPAKGTLVRYLIEQPEAYPGGGTVDADCTGNTTGVTREFMERIVAGTDPLPFP